MGMYLFGINQVSMPTTKNPKVRHTTYYREIIFLFFFVRSFSCWLFYLVLSRPQIISHFNLFDFESQSVLTLLQYNVLWMFNTLIFRSVCFDCFRYFSNFMPRTIPYVNMRPQNMNVLCWCMCVTNIKSPNFDYYTI